MSDAPIHRGSAFTTLSASYARVDIDRALPCIVFLVHGVNDNGVAYEAQDQGLCAGLNARLNRGASLTRPGGDLHHYDFANADTPKKYDALLAKLDKTDPARAERLRSDPDAVLFRPGAIPGQTYSPVIPFYWGYREQEGINPDTRKPYIDREHWHGQWLDRWGNRLDKDGAKEGGPFINATSNLPDCWSDGQGPGMAGLLDALKRDAMRPMKGAPNRRYFVLAARRLAMLIRLVRNQPETRHAAVNLVAHSQGCMISLLAQAMLAEDGVQPADTLVLQNPPYSLEEPTLEFTGSAQQTTVARLQTLINLVRFVHEKAQSSPSLADVHAGVPRHGVAGPHWAPGTARKVVDANIGAVTFAERDNRGKVYLYFCPDDGTVALRNVQGIGWKGVPDTMRAIVRERRVPGERQELHYVSEWQTLPAMTALREIGFRQRIFAHPERDAQAQVGERCGYDHRLRPADSPSPASWHARERARTASGDPDKPAPLTLTQSGLDANETRHINGELLQPPCKPDLGAATCDIDAIDASIAMSSGRVERLKVRTPTADPRPPARHGQPLTAEELRTALARAQAAWDARAAASGYPIDNASRMLDIASARDATGQLVITREETPNEMKRRLMEDTDLRNANENSYHSGVPANARHHEFVTAYDLSLGEPVPFEMEYFGWLEYLRAVADWRTKWQSDENDSDTDADAIPSPDNKQKNELAIYWRNMETDHQCKAWIDKTFTYHKHGLLPDDLPEISSLKLVNSANIGQRKSQSNGKQ